MSEREANKSETRPEVTVHYHPESTRFEATLSGTDEVAILEVTPSDELWAFKHTEVPESMGGRGVGSELVRQALQHARELGVKVRPVCPFTAAYIRRHPDELDLVHPDFRDQVQG